jgi:hypothetical protein
MLFLIKFNIKMFLLNFLIVLSLQATNVTILGIKIGEFFFLFVLPFLIIHNNKIYKTVAKLIFFILGAFFITVLINISTTFYIPNIELSFIKYPYFITIARFFELIACLSLVILLRTIKNYYVIEYKFHEFIIIFFKLNALFGIIFIIFYILHILDIYQTTMIYGESNRLRGLFVEGGPFGLYYAFLLSLGFFLRINKLILILFLILIFLAQSKAGMSFIIFIIALNLFYFKINSNFLKIFGISVSVGILILGVYYIANNYIQDIQNLEVLLQTRANDNNFVMGRIAGLFIGVEIIKDNPLFGIGLGNYSLVRNDPNYLGLFPQIDGWDLTGLGIFTLIIELGFVGFFIFTSIIYLLFRRLDNLGKIILIIFYFVFFFGVQIYFLYPWFALGLVLTLSKKEKDNFENSYRL